MASADERLMKWLREAHAMEEQAEKMLINQGSRIRNSPALRARIERHLADTKRQRERLRGCIERRGGTAWTSKHTAPKMVAMSQVMNGIFIGDDIVKGSLAAYTFEQMEIASYSVLIAAAEAVGDTETARLCAEILREEEMMAAWLRQVMMAAARAQISSDSRFFPESTEPSETATDHPANLLQFRSGSPAGHYHRRDE